MEPATKRRKTAAVQTDTEEDDELFLEPEELNQRRDPSFQLAEGRAKAATQLKSRFEDIFAKYERDFTGIGDEIDLETGEVVVDNGHLSSMRSMKDWIIDDDEDEDEEEEEEEEEEEGDHKALPGDTGKTRLDFENGFPRDPWQISEPSWPSNFASREPHPLASLIPPQSRPTNQSQPSPPVSHDFAVSADPAWQAPELPLSAFLGKTLGSNGRHYGGTTPVVTRTVLRKSVKAPGSPEADDEDDLQTASGHASDKKDNTRQSPLINKTFPTVDSSPQDNGLNDLIQDVIKNIPDTPPSIRRSRLTKSQGKPSPLNQEHRIRSIQESKLRISDTPLDGNSRGGKTPTKRAMRHQACANPVIKEKAFSTLRDECDQSSWEESDLESFQDVTSQGITKPAGQILYVDIRPNNFTRKGMLTTAKIPSSKTNDVGLQDEGSTVHRDLAVDSLKQRPGLTDVGLMAPDHQGQDTQDMIKFGQPRKIDKKKSPVKFERNLVDPSFIFSDEEILLPKRSKKKMMRNSDRVSHAEDTHSPMEAAPMISTFKEQPASGYQTHDSAAKSVDQRRQSVRLCSDPNLSIGSVAKQGNTGVSSTDTEQLPSVDVASHFDLIPDQETEPPMAGAKSRVSEPSCQSTARLATDQSERRREQIVTVEAMKANKRTRAHSSGARSRSSNQHQTTAIPERLPPTEPEPALPTTPSRPRSKQKEKKSPSFNNSIMSLLSDSDDDEDELSFTLSDFTPSGHHRILAHRPFPKLPTTPRLSASSTKNKKRAGLFHSRSNSASSHRISRMPRTPCSAGSDKAIHTRKHRKSQPLARSVVRVGTRRDRNNDDREGSVLQTPGGSKRQCGVDGWKCERDFCFVCME